MVFINHELPYFIKQAYLNASKVLRGKDIEIYHNNSISGGFYTSAEIDGSISIGGGYFLGDPRDLSSGALGGNQYSISAGAEIREGAGLGINGGMDFGLDDKGRLSTIGYKISLSGGVGIATPISGSLTTGHASNATPILKLR